MTLGVHHKDKLMKIPRVIPRFIMKAQEDKIELQEARERKDRERTWRELCFERACVWSNATNCCRFSAPSTNNLLANSGCKYQITHERWHDYNFEENEMNQMNICVSKRLQQYLLSCTKGSLYISLSNPCSSFCLVLTNYWIAFFGNSPLMRCRHQLIRVGQQVW